MLAWSLKVTESLLESCLKYAVDLGNTLLAFLITLVHVGTREKVLSQDAVLAKPSSVTDQNFVLMYMKGLPLCLPGFILSSSYLVILCFS